VTPRKKTHSLPSNTQAETIARSARQKRHSSASRHQETSSAKRGTRSPSKQKETLTCQQVRARECVCARGPEQGRVCVREKESACDTQHKSAKKAERVNTRLSRRFACWHTKQSHSRDTREKKTHSLASNKQAETIARSARQKRHSSASKYKETSSCQPAKRGTRSPSKQKEAITCRQVRARECVCARGPERERQRVRARERECVRQTKQEREAAKKTHSLASNKQEETITRSARQKRGTRLLASIKRRALVSQQKEALARPASRKRHSPASKCAHARVCAREGPSKGGCAC